LSLFSSGGSGSSWFDVKPLGVDGSSGGFGCSIFNLQSLKSENGVLELAHLGCVYLLSGSDIAYVGCSFD